jgi:hypothetical protein
MEAGTPMSDPDSPEPRVERSGGANFEVQGDVHIHGDVIGRDKMTGGSGGSETPPSLPPQPPSSPPPQPLSSRAEPPDREPWLAFQNREHELEELLRELTNPSGNHFYIVLAGPQMGKTQLLEQLVIRLKKKKPKWHFYHVDLHKAPLDFRSDANHLLLGTFQVVKEDREKAQSVAVNIIKHGHPTLLVLDGGELLEDSAVVELRGYLSQISKYVSESHKGIWFACVIASRRFHGGWKGVSPYPRFARLPLTHFDQTVVEKALRTIAGSSHDKEWYQKNAINLHGASKGLPALLVRYMKWMQEKEFAGLDRIGTQDLFNELAVPYVQETVLSIWSLLQAGGNELAPKRFVIERTLLHLSPHRLFTYALVQTIVGIHNSLEDDLLQLGWTIDDLWQAIDRTHLIQPADEIWRVMYPAIRRILFRFAYIDASVQADAHAKAEQFYSDQSNSVLVTAGKEQSVFFVERLWHKAESLRLRPMSDVVQQLEAFVDDLFVENIRPDGFTRQELVNYVCERALDDSELQEALDMIQPGLLRRLLQRGGCK